MKHYLLNHQPQKGLQAACAQQGQAPTCNARGKGRTPASPKTLTRILLVLLTMFLLPSAAWGVEVIKKITFNKQVGTVTSDIDNSKMSVSVTEQITGESSTSYNYDGQVIIWDYYNRLSQYSCSTNGGAVFTLNNENTHENESFTIEIPGVYPNVPTQVTLTVAYSNSDATNTGENKIQVGDYGNGTQTTSPPGTGADAATYYHYYHPYRSHDTSLIETTLTYTGNNTSGLGTNRDEPKSQNIFVYLKGGATFTIKEATITYETNNYGLTVAGIPVTSANAADILGDQSSSVSFTPAEGTNPATLTLNGAEINYESGNVIVSTLTTPLKVALSGNSTINSGSYLPFEGATDTNANLVFSGGDGTSLVMDSKVNGFSPTSFYTGFNEVSYEGKLHAYVSGTNVVIEKATAIPYGLTIAGVEVTSENLNTETGAITGLDNVTFTPATNTLKLNNAVISGSIYTTLESLIIDITNTNSIATSGSKNGIVSTTNTGTLTFTGTGSLEISSDCSVIRGFTAIEGLNLETKTPYEIYNDGYYRLKDKAAADSTGVKWLKVIQQATYPLWIAGTQVTEVNASNITGTGITVLGSTEEGDGISFSNTDNQLTLKNVTIDYSNTFADPIISSIENLNVKLIGINKINIANTSYCGFKYTGTNGTLTFVDPTSFSEIGQLTVFKESSSLSDANLCSGYTISNQFESSGDENFTPQNSGWTKITPAANYVKVRYVELYDLWIEGARISSNNLTGNGYQNYDPKTSSINYSGATSSARIVSNLPELTIILSGENSLNVTDGTDPAISFTASEKTPTGILKFAKDKNSASTINKMTIDCANGAIVGFSEVTTDDPLKLSVPTTAPTTWDNSTTKVVISDEVLYDLWVGGVQVSSANASDIFGAAQSSQTVPAIFDAEESTLTLNGLQLSNSTTYPTCIESGLESLTVTLSGDNKFQKGGDVTTLYGFKAQDGKTCNITFEASGSFSFMVQTEPEYAVSGFNKVTYKDNLVAYKKDGKTYISTLRLQFGADNTDNPTAITISPEQEGVELFSHKIAYEINYAKDGMDNIAQTEYTAAIPIATISAGPCIVSAYTIDGDNTKSNATKSYYFIYSESELIIGTESTLDLRNYLLPSIAEEDNWSCEHMTDNTDIISIDSQNGIITGLADGTATVSTQIIDGNEEYSVLNYYISQLSIDVTVQDIIGESTFASGQSYGTFYNTTEAYNLPEGLKAYIITNVDEEKGTIEMTETSVLPPNTPVLIYRTSTTGTPNYVFTKASNVEPATTKLKYTTTDKSADESSKLYVLYNGQFVRVTANTTILANHCYLDLSGTTAGTRGFYNIGDGEGTTSLREVKSEGVKGEKWNDGEWYTLQGRKFTTKPTKPGLYILNGKKVVIK